VTMEVRIAPIGRLAMADIRALLGRELKTVVSVGVMVLDPDGGLPFVGYVELGWKPSGHGQHRALVCPRCRRCLLVLHTDGVGGIACAPCLKKLSRRNRERTTTAWNELGGREEERLFRLIRRRDHRAAGALAELLRGDADRLAAMMPRIEAALTVADVEANRPEWSAEERLIDLTLERVAMGPAHWI
jgi:hypothetical protein